MFCLNILTYKFKFLCLVLYLLQMNQTLRAICKHTSKSLTITATRLLRCEKVNEMILFLKNNYLLIL